MKIGSFLSINGKQVLPFYVNNNIPNIYPEYNLVASLVYFH